VRPGITTADLNAAGAAVVKELTGHGVGRTIHEAPVVPNFDDPGARGRLIPGMVLAVEPILSMGSGRCEESRDGWTVRTADGAWAAHYEQTIVVTDGAPLILTATA
jgi:methionyl aminopeptidase